MRRSDILAILVTFLAVGIGAYMSTYSAEIVRYVGLTIIVLSVAGILVWIVHGEAKGIRWVPTVVISVLALSICGEILRDAVINSYTEKRLRELTNQELIDESLSVVKEMEGLQADTNKAAQQRLLQHKGMFDLYIAMENQFLKDIRPRARDLAVEVLRRLGNDPPYPSSITERDGALVLLNGFVTGPEPVGDAADFLDYETKRLPP